MLKIKKRRDQDTDLICYDIYITRGDSGYIGLELVDDHDQVIDVGDNDTIRCQVRKEPNDGEIVFNGTIEKSEDTYVWHILPENTRGKDVAAEYWYDIEIEFSNGDVFTFVPTSKFALMSETTMVEG